MSSRAVLRRRSLIVATSTHSDARLSPLASPAADAVEVHSLLADPRRGDFDSRLLVDATAAEVRRELERFLVAEVDRSDLILVFYSGHGVKDDDGNLYLTTSDTSLDLLRSTAVPARYVNELMAASRAASQIVVLDCCFSGAFGHGLLPKSGAEPGIVEALRPPDGGSGRVVLTASSGVQYSFEAKDVTGERARSLYTSALVEGLRSGLADSNGDGIISASEWHQYASRRVGDVTMSQRPRMWSFDVEDEPIVARVVGRSPADPPRPLPPQPSSLPAPEPPGSAPTSPPRTRPALVRWVVAASGVALVAGLAAYLGVRNQDADVGTVGTVGTVVTTIAVDDTSKNSLDIAPPATLPPSATSAASVPADTLPPAGVALSRPTGIEVFGNVAHLWAVDCEAPVLLEVTEGQPIRPRPEYGTALGCPADIAAVQIDGAWNWYISERDNGQLLTFTASNDARVLQPQSELSLGAPTGLVGSTPKLYIADQELNCVLEYDIATNLLTQHVGRCGQAGAGSEGQPPTDFLLNSPDGLALHGGRLLIVDSGNNRVVATDGTTVQLVAGSADGSAGFGGDGGAAVNALLSDPRRIIGFGDDIYITDYGNGRIRKIDAAGTITTLVGGGTGDPNTTSDPLAANILPFAIDHKDDALIFSSIVETPGIFTLDHGVLRPITLADR